MKMNTKSFTKAIVFLVLCAVTIISVFADDVIVLLHPNHIFPSRLSEEVPINEWTLIGPFRFSEDDIKSSNPHAALGGINRDVLAQFGIPEASIATDGVANLCSLYQQCLKYSPHSPAIVFDQLFPGETYAVIYAFAEIYSASAGDVGLELGSDDGVKVWLNGDLLLATKNDVNRAAFKYDHLLVAHLKRGLNRILMKVDQKIDTWALITTVMPIAQMENIRLTKADGHLCAARFITSRDSLSLNVSSFRGSGPLTLTIRDSRGNGMLFKQYSVGETINIPVESWSDGYYSVAVEFGGHILHDAFYVGDPNIMNHQVYRIQLSAPQDGREYIEREPIIERFNILTAPKYYHPSDVDWQKKMLMVLKEESDTVSDPDYLTWSRTAGFHLRQYISRIDNTRQPYLLYIPGQHKNPLPLVVIMPYAEAPVRPFLESSLIAWPDDLEAMSRAADASGMAVAVVNGRGTVGDAPIGEDDAFEVISDVDRDFSMDESRIYLYGTCEGGRRALLLAEHFPGIFAAVGVYGPLVTPYPTRDSEADKRVTDVKSLSQALRYTPVLLVKGALDSVSSTESLEDFYRILKRNGSPSEIQIIPDGMHKQKNLEASVFPFLARYENHTSPGYIMGRIMTGGITR
jgi:hypothetical protein